MYLENTALLIIIYTPSGILLYSFGSSGFTNSMLLPFSRPFYPEFNVFNNPYNINQRIQPSRQLNGYATGFQQTLNGRPNAMLPTSFLTPRLSSGYGAPQTVWRNGFQFPRISSAFQPRTGRSEVQRREQPTIITTQPLQTFSGLTNSNHAGRQQESTSASNTYQGGSTSGDPVSSFYNLQPFANGGQTSGVPSLNQQTSPFQRNAGFTWPSNLYSLQPTQRRIFGFNIPYNIQFGSSLGVQSNNSPLIGLSLPTSFQGQIPGFALSPMNPTASQTRSNPTFNAPAISPTIGQNPGYSLNVPAAPQPSNLNPTFNFPSNVPVAPQPSDPSMTATSPTPPTRRFVECPQLNEPGTCQVNEFLQ